MARKNQHVGDESKRALEAYQRMMEGSRKGGEKTRHIAELAHKAGLTPQGVKNGIVVGRGQNSH